VLEEASMDFITSLPNSEGKRVITVIVGRLTKYAHFCELSHLLNLVQLLLHLWNNSKATWNPKIIVSDKEPIFTGNFWTKLFSCLGTQLAHSSSYHPQFNGKNEIMNSVALYLINKHNGLSGYLWLNGGIRLPSILQQNLPHLWHFMDIIHHPSHHI